LKIVDSGLVGPMPTTGGAFMPAVTALPSGELIGTRFVAETLVAPNAHFEVMRSSDGGRTWTDPINPWPIDKWSYRTPHIYAPNSAANGGNWRLLITGTRFHTDSSPTTFDPKTRTVQRGEMFLAWSSDDGHTWDAPIPIPPPLDPARYSCNGSGVLLFLNENRWMYPFETWLPTGATTKLDQKAAAIFSADQGKTWPEMAVVADDPSGRYTYWDHAGTVLPDGRIYETMWVRDTEANQDLPIHWTVSADGGRTWTEPEPTGLTGQASAPVALRNGQVAVLYTHRTGPEGVRLAVGFSEFKDEVVIFDAGDEALLGSPDRTDALATNMAQDFGKMNGTLLASGELMLTYWATVEKISHTRWSRVRIS
jgi:hypothetical protein